MPVSVQGLVPHPQPPRYVIQADVAALPPGKFERRDRLLADAYDIMLDDDGRNATVTLTRNATADRTLRVSAAPDDYRAVRIFVSGNYDGTALGPLVAGVVLAPSGALVTELRLIVGML